MPNLNREDAQMIAQEMAKENAKLLSGMARASSPSSGGATFDFSKLGIGGFDTAVRSATSGVMALWKGTATAGDALGVFTTVVGKLPIVGTTLATLTGKFGDAVIGTNDNLNQAAKFGANFNNNLVQYDNLIKGARLTQEQYNDMVRNNSVALNGLGSTVNRSQANFLLFTKELQESPVGRQLQEMGVSAEEIAKMGEASIANSRGLNLADANARRQAVEAAQMLALEMEQTARITGKSREQQAADIKARSENVVVQAAVMQLGGDALERYKEMNGKLQGLGKGVQDVADEIFTGGIRTKEGAAKFAALGPAGADLEKAVLMQKNATDGKSRIEAAEAMAKAKAAIDDYQRSKSYLDMVQYGTGAASEAARASMKENIEAKALATKRAEEEAKGEKPKTTAELAKDQKVEVTKSLVKGEDETGKVAPGTEVGRSINAVNRALLDVTAGTSIGFGKLVEKTNDLVGGFGNLSAKLPPLKQEEAAAIPGKAIDAIGKTIETAYSKAKGEAKAEPTRPANEIPKRDVTTLGATGQLFEPNDFYGKVAAGETVMSPAQLKNLVSGVASTSKMPDVSSMAVEVSKQLGQSPMNGAPDLSAIVTGFMPTFETLKTSFTEPKLQTQPPAQTEQPKADQRSQFDASSSEISMKDLHDDLVQLNKMMGELVSHSADSVDASHRIARATKNAGNRLLPV